MTWKTHAAGGFLFGSATALLIKKNIPDFPYGQDIVFCISSALFSSVCALLPDIDEKKSTAGRKLWFISWPIYLLQLLIKIPALFNKIFKSASKVVGHRGVTHYPITWLLLTGMAAGIASIIHYSNINYITKMIFISILFGFSIGILSHIIYDFFSGKIKLLGPISQKEYGVSLIKTNSILEKVVLILSYFAAVRIIYIFLQTR